MTLGLSKMSTDQLADEYYQVEQMKPTDCLDIILISFNERESRIFSLNLHLGWLYFQESVFFIFMRVYIAIPGAAQRSVQHLITRVWGARGASASSSSL